MAYKKTYKSIQKTFALKYANFQRSKKCFIRILCTFIGFEHEIVGFYTGLFLLICIGVAATVSGIMLGKAWTILLKLYPMSTHCRKPYPEIGLRAIGPTIRFKFYIKLFCLHLLTFA